VAWTALTSLEHDDEDRYDLEKGMPDGYEASDYPSGCCFQISKADLERAGCEGGEPGDTCRFSAMGEVTSIFKSMDGCRIEIELSQFAGEDGKFFALDTDADGVFPSAPMICLCQRELEKMGLDADCERGDMIHLIGTARLESTSSTEYGGDMHCLQITELSCEDESTESRNG
jgi:hypothetical protein